MADLTKQAQMDGEYEAPSDPRYVYRTCALVSDLFTVGFYSPDGVWHIETAGLSRADASERVHWLNGGSIVPEKPKLPRATSTVIRISRS